MPTEQRDPPAHNRAVVLDSFAWIEYFNGTSAGERVQGLMENGLAVTPAIVVAELSEKYRRLNRERSEEHTSELQSRGHLVCRLLLEKKKKKKKKNKHKKS